MAILDASGTPIGAVSNIEEGEAKALTLTLEPQKYFVEVVSNIDYGDGYSLETQGGDGAFGSYASITARCGAARSATTAAGARLRRAEAKLQRAIARLRRSLYSPRAVRRSAQAAYRKAKGHVAPRRKALKAARRSERPWCFISQ